MVSGAEGRDTGLPRALAKCHALVNNTNLVVLLFLVGIKTMELIGPQTSIREGSAAYIECIAYGSKPAAEIIWRNG